jgi:hypothetical protein
MYLSVTPRCIAMFTVLFDRSIGDDGSVSVSGTNGIERTRTV